MSEEKGINIFTAQQARDALIGRKQTRSAFVDYNKMAEIFNAIEESIRAIPVDDSKKGIYTPAEFIYSQHLSIGEKKYLSGHGYTVKYEDDGGMTGDFYRITW